MDGNEVTLKEARPSPGRRLASVGLVAGGLFAGAILAGTHIAGAQSPTSTSSANATASGGSTDPATVKHGPGDTLLTDGTATRMRAAALGSVPGGTIVRVETDSAGSPYGAHGRQCDVSSVTA